MEGPAVGAPRTRDQTDGALRSTAFVPSGRETRAQAGPVAPAAGTAERPRCGRSGGVLGGKARHCPCLRTSRFMRPPWQLGLGAAVPSRPVLTSPRVSQALLSLLCWPPARASEGSGR